jgi:hypothetical protein
MLRIEVGDDIPTRRAIEAVLEDRTKRWSLESEGSGADGQPELTYYVRLKKRTPPDALLEALREQLGERTAKFTPGRPEADGSQPAT